ncbi:MAG: glycosyltransferase family 4 protein, partial [Anaerolineales bacterium]|nr:glycosyltransferase family 4 protein [Anaerolineales bacterium]
WLDSINPLTWWQTLRRIRAYQPDLVIVPWWVPFWAPLWGYLSWGMKRWPHAPQLLFICHNVLPHERSRLDVAAVRLALQRGDAYIVHAQEQAAVLQNIFPNAPIVVTPHPTYETLGSAKTELPTKLPAGRPLILFCGLIRPYKGVDILLNALPLVLKEQLVHCAIVGEFWDNDKPYRQQIEQLGIQEQVTIVNKYVENEVLAAYVALADVVVLPYRSATQSGVIQLAFGQHTPVITTNVGGLPDVVDHEKTGLIVAPEDPAALAQAIVRYFAQQLKTQFQQNIAQGQQRYSWQNLIREIETLFAK